MTEAPVEAREGDYAVQVHVIEARDLKGRGQGDMSDPVVSVQVFGHTQHTDIKHNALSPAFDQVLYFHKKHVQPDEIHTEKIRIAVLDANTFSRNVLIGAFDFDIARIYYSDNHEIFRSWVALTDTSGTHQGIQGYLKLSITVLGPGDKQHIHDEHEVEDENDIVIMPPSIEQKGYLMKVKLYSVCDLPQMDEGLIGEKCDPYIVVEFGGRSNKSNKRKGQNANFLEEIQIPVNEPIMSDVVKISLWDFDNVAKDDLIATTTLSYKKIKSGEYKQPMWLNFYGAPEGMKLHYSEKMNKGFVEGSFFRGKLLVDISIEPSEIPKPGIESIPVLPENKFPVLINYTIQCDVYQVLEIPKGKWSVELAVGNHYFSTKEIEAAQGVLKYYSSLEQQKGVFNLQMLLPENVNFCPDVYLYLSKSKKRVCYYRFSFQKLLDFGWKSGPQWFPFKEDKAIDGLDSDEFPGILLAGIRAGRSDQCPQSVAPEARPFLSGIISEEEETDEKNSSITSGVSELNLRKLSDPLSVGNLKITVLEGKDLPAADSNGFSDPFVKVSVMKESWKTRVVKRTLNPVWNESQEFKDVHISTEVSFQVYDDDLLRKSLLGSAQVALSEISKEKPGDDFVVESWFLIGSEKSRNAKIKLRFEFAFHSIERASQLNARPSKKVSVKKFFVSAPADVQKGAEYFGQPVLSQYQLRAHIYQARELLAADLSGSSDPYIVIRCAGQFAKTNVREKTLNPVYYVTKTLNVQLPTPLSLAPDVSIVVYDKDVIGKDEPIGRVSIPIRIVQQMNPGLEQLEPQWFKLQDVSGNFCGGAILMSLQLLPVEMSGQSIPSLEPKCVPMFIEIAALGLRNLNSTFGVHKPRIEFELPNGKKFMTHPSAKPSAHNPNMLEILEIPINIPLDPKFAPTLNVQIIDYILGGFIKRRIGTSSLLLENFMSKDDEKSSSGNDSVPVNHEDLKKEIESEEKKRSNTLNEEQKDKTLQGNISHSHDEFEGQAHDNDTAPILVNVKNSGNPSLAIDPSGKAEFEMISLKSPSKVDDHEQVAVEILEEKDAKVEQDGLKKNEQSAKSEFASCEWGEKLLRDEEDVPTYRRERKNVDSELESSVNMKPFDEISLYTGKAKLGSLSRSVGTFKGLIKLTDTKESPKSIDVSEFMTPKDLFVRLYILQGKHLTPLDSNGKSDPYLKVSIGKHKVNLRSSYKINTLDPEFYESFEFPVQIPGASSLKIEVWDWDGLGDDLIGETTIDIEDRWFSKEWRSLEKKPIEWRTLLNPSSSISQGKIELWVDIMDSASAKLNPMINISPPPKEPWELRVIVWQCKEVTIKDEITQQNDLYITGLLDSPGQKKKRTDTHLRSKKGKGSFNWRMKYQVELPMKNPRFNIQVWDMDIFSANDFICEATLNLSSLSQKAFKVKDRTKLIKDGSDRIWISDFRHPNEPGKSQGQVEVSFELLPSSLLSQLPAGEGRSDPNMNPILPPPEGRLEWMSMFLNPAKLLRELLGDRLYYKLCCILFIGLLVTLIAFFAPTFFSNLLSRIIVK
jgi:hypothetical protein